MRCAIITGSSKSFAAGADIKNMMDNKFVDNVVNNLLEIGRLSVNVENQ